MVPGPAKLKIVGVRWVRNDVSVPLPIVPQIGDILSIIRAKL